MINFDILRASNVECSSLNNTCGYFDLEYLSKFTDNNSAKSFIKFKTSNCNNVELRIDLYNSTNSKLFTVILSMGSININTIRMNELYELTKYFASTFLISKCYVKYTVYIPGGELYDCFSKYKRGC